MAFVSLIASLAVGQALRTMPEKNEDVAILHTSLGDVVLMFYPEVSPKHVDNFKSLVKEGFYNGTRFHRCIKDFMIQGGDPKTKDLTLEAQWGTGGKMRDDGSERNVDAEFNSKVLHKRGVLSMARSSDPNSASSQFFIMVHDYPSLDNQYSSFGRVVKGMDVVDKIVKTGDENDNGKVQPKDAVMIKTAEMKKWPL